MPVAVYHNDGTGRDSYVNGSCLSEASRRSARNAGAAQVLSFWPNEALERHRVRHFESSLSLSGSDFGTSLVMSSPSSARATPQHSQPRSARGALPNLPVIPTTVAGRYKSPTRELRLGGEGDGFSGRGTPRKSARQQGQGFTMETTTQYAQRTGRFVTPREAPAQSPRLPGLRLHQNVGILDEV